MGKTTRRVFWLTAAVVVGSGVWLVVRGFRMSGREKTPSLVVLVHVAIRSYEEETGRSPETLSDVQQKLSELCRGATVAISSNGVGVFVVEMRVANRREQVTFRQRVDVAGHERYYWTGD